MDAFLEAGRPSASGWRDEVEESLGRITDYAADTDDPAELTALLARLQGLLYPETAQAARRMPGPVSCPREWSGGAVKGQGRL